ncbi:GGDEF domain-containing protein [Oryzibacter oryziterrae]|uniref:GGDEF domain-containing protein n=1 Tax=Oryzibacter oryziterrae TaxID=2766474 RepID=UPI001F013221|nr:GGDEF domain-containing protein [Oryzibacter oryziterrae]
MSALCPPVASGEERLAQAWSLGCLGRSDEARSLLLEHLEQAKAQGDWHRVACCQTDLAWCCFQIGYPEEGLTLARAAIEHWRSVQDHEYLARTGAFKAWLLLEIGLTEDAFSEAITALNHADQQRNLAVSSLCLNVIAVIFWNARVVDRAFEFVNKAIDIAKALHDDVMMSWWLINLGGIWGEASDIAREAGEDGAWQSKQWQAIAFQEEAYNLACATGDTWAQRLCLMNSADAYLYLGKLKLAEEKLLAYETLEGADYRRCHDHFLSLKARALLDARQIEEAIGLFEKVRELGLMSNRNFPQMNASQFLSDAYARQGNFEKALEEYKRFHICHLQFTEETTQKHVRLSEVSYDIQRLRRLAEHEAQRAIDLERNCLDLKLKNELLAAAALLDPLTGLNNRRQFEISQAELDSRNRLYSLAMIDVDHFKRVNDRFSHLVGDKVLRRLGQLLKENSRASILAARLGGEEFALLMPRTGTDGTHEHCENLRQLIARHNWVEIAAGLKITVSIGVASTIERIDRATIAALADARLYQAKSAGRNCVVSCLDRRRLRA